MTEEITVNFDDSDKQLERDWPNDDRMINHEIAITFEFSKAIG